MDPPVGEVDLYLVPNAKLLSLRCVGRYRKVAADKCRGGKLIDKYHAVNVSCPVIKPAGLSVEVTGGNVIAVRNNVSFTLTQERVI